MDSEQDQIVRSLREKFRQITSFYDKAVEEKSQLQEENNRLFNQIKSREEELKNYKAKYENLKVAKSILAESEDPHDARIKVNKIVREIDKCIALLNR